MTDADRYPGLAWYTGESRFLRLIPWAFALLAAVALFNGDLFTTVALGVPAAVVALVMPWRFEIDPTGIALFFGLGRHRYFARDTIRIRAGRGGTVVFPGSAERLGYPLTAGLVEHDRLELRRLVLVLGFDVVD